MDNKNHSYRDSKVCIRFICSVVWGWMGLIRSLFGSFWYGNTHFQQRFEKRTMRHSFMWLACRIRKAWHVTHTRLVCMCTPYRYHMNYTQSWVCISLYFFYPLPFLLVQRSARFGGPKWSEKICTSFVTKICTSFVFRKDPHLWHVGTRQLSTIVVETGVKRSV